jgi:6-phosphofructokinase 2
VLDVSHDLEYRFVPEGPTVSEDEWRAILTAVAETEGEWLIGSGSLPNGVPQDAYAQVARIAARRGQRFVLDTSGVALRAALGNGIELVKPSLGELEHLVGRELKDPHEQEVEAMALVRSGAARMVAVTLGPDGAVLATEDGLVRMAALKVPVHTAVGAGDAFLAGMTLALARGDTPEEALAWGTAAGSAAIGSAGTARLHRADVEARYRELRAGKA